MKKVVGIFGIAIVIACCSFAYADGKNSKTGGSQILGEQTTWRCYFTFGTQAVRRISGEIVHADIHELYRKIKSVAKGAKKQYEFHVHKPFTISAPSLRRHDVDFNDSLWGHFTTPLCTGKVAKFGKGRYHRLQMISLRGKFIVDDPAKVGDLQLNLKYQGGVAVYFNGKEVGRNHLPKGKLNKLTPAQDYGMEAFVDAKGKPIMYRGSKDLKLESAKIRELPITIPASQIKKGTNVLSLDIHGAPISEAYLEKFLDNKGKMKGRSSSDTFTYKYRYFWSLSGLKSLRLTSKLGGGIVNSPTKSVHVWNRGSTTAGRVYVSDFDFREKLHPVTIVSPQNGSFSGQVVVGSKKDINGLQAKTSNLSGPGGAVIPASSVVVRWGMPNGIEYGKYDKAPYFDGLAETPPVKVPVFKKTGVAVQTVWITVSTPPDAAPGNYKGKITLTMKNSPAIEVPIDLRVAGWKVPEKPFTTVVDMVQSPDTLSMWYKVPMWSRKHWKLIKRSFKVLGTAGGNSCSVTAIRRSHFGNEHSMIFWTRKPDGSLVPDLSIAKRYIDTAVKQLGELRVVILYLWEPGGSTRHAGGMGLIMMDRDILISVKNPKTGLLEKVKGPKWGTQECTDFWKPVIDGIRDILAQHDLEKSLVIGVAGDRRPSKTAVKNLAAAAPYAHWYIHSHQLHKTTFYGQPIAFRSQVYPGSIANPLANIGKPRAYLKRWEFRPILVTDFPRGRTCMMSSPEVFKLITESIVIEGDMRGWGRIGADFWGVLDSHSAGFGSSRTKVNGVFKYNLSSRYPDAAWDNLGISFTIPAMLSPGPNGALSTMRLEAIREGVQENEARFLLERMLRDAKTRAMLGEDLVKRCQRLLDERTLACMRDRYVGLGWMGIKIILNSGEQNRSERLFALAAEVAKKTNGGK